MREAVREIAREAVFEALVPALDQTRTVGLVTLPGAFVRCTARRGECSRRGSIQIVVLVDCSAHRR